MKSLTDTFQLRNKVENPGKWNFKGAVVCHKQSMEYGTWL